MTCTTARKARRAKDPARSDINHFERRTKRPVLAFRPFSFEIRVVWPTLKVPTGLGGHGTGQASCLVFSRFCALRTCPERVYECPDASGAPATNVEGDAVGKNCTLVSKVKVRPGFHARHAISGGSETPRHAAKIAAEFTQSGCRGAATPSDAPGRLGREFRTAANATCSGARATQTHIRNNQHTKESSNWGEPPDQ